MDLTKIKKEFDALPADVQWYWIIVDERHLIEEIIIDNDNTSVHLFGDNDCLYPLYPKSHCGNSNGVLHILRALGINANHC